MMKYQDYNWEQFPTGNVMIRPWVAKEHDSLKVVHYRVGRYSDFDPNGPPQSGSFSELATTESTYYADYAWGGLPEGWYCYAIKCVYNSGYSSDWIVSDNWYGFKYNAGVNVSMSDQSDPNAIYVSLAGYYPVNDVFATLTNMEGNAHFYEIPAGEYKLLAFKPRFDLFTVDTLVINNDTAFSGFVLQETRIPVDSLMVNPFTGVLEWKNANITQFDWNCGDQGICHEVTTSEIVLGVYSNWVLSCEFLYNAEFEQDYLDYSTDYGRTWAHILQLEPSPEAQKLEISLDSLTNQGGANTFRFQLRDNHGSPFYLDINSMSIWSPDINVDPESYQVILNSQEASWTDSISFLLPFLENDIVYQAGIAANYSTGLADTVFIEFTYHKLFAPENFALSYTGDSLLFTWSPPSGSWAAWSQEHDFPNAFKGYHLEMVTGNNIYHHYIYDCFDTSLTLFHSGCDTVRATMTAVYDLNDYGYPGDTVESQPTGPIEFNGTGAFLDKLEEEWSSLTFSANCWNTNGQGLSIRPDEGNPGAAFVFRNSNDPYIAFLESNPIILKPITDGPQVLEFDLKLETDSQSGNDALEAQVRSDGSGIWIMVQGVNTIHGSIDWMHFRLYLEENLFSDKFSIRFLFYGSGEDETIWTIDNIRLHNLCPGPATFNAQRASDTEVFLSWGGMTQGYSAGRSLASYNIYRKYDQEEFTLLAETTDSIYIDTVSAGGQYCYQVSAIYNDNGTLCESPLTDSSCVISYLGFEENQPTDRIRVYPNPSRDHLVISCADENIQSLMIYNSIGIIREIKGDDKKEMILSLKDLVPGIYFIRINLEDEFYLEKIILLD